jgi:hypothetical protein
MPELQLFWDGGSITKKAQKQKLETNMPGLP